MSVLTDIKNRGVEDILIACMDGLTGFPDAVKAVFLDTHIQHCIVHMIRNSTKFVSYKDCNTQRKKRFFETITHLVKNHAMCKSFAHSVFLFMAASSIQV